MNKTLPCDKIINCIEFTFLTIQRSIYVCDCVCVYLKLVGLDRRKKNTDEDF